MKVSRHNLPQMLIVTLLITSKLRLLSVSYPTFVHHDDLTTSITDYKTDAVIQSSLRNELGNDVTVITIAHRLQTIMDADKIASATFHSCPGPRLVVS